MAGLAASRAGDNDGLRPVKSISPRDYRSWPGRECREWSGDRDRKTSASFSVAPQLPLAQTGLESLPAMATGLQVCSIPILGGLPSGQNGLFLSNENSTTL